MNTECAGFLRDFSSLEDVAMSALPLSRGWKFTGNDRQIVFKPGNFYDSLIKSKLRFNLKLLLKK